MTSPAITGWGLCTREVPYPDRRGFGEGGWTSPVADHHPRAVSLALRAARRAWQQARLEGVDPQRIGITVSASKPIFFPEGDMILPPEVVNNAVALEVGARGPRRNIIAACATGAYAIAVGAQWIEQELCDVVLAGSAEALPTPLIRAGFQQMGVLTQEPVMRPFDRRRSGFWIGEGAGVVVLESEHHAIRRGAPVRAQLAGWALGCDAHSAVAFNSNGRVIARVILEALSRAGIAKEAVQHVNAHGTATSLNDWVETLALQEAFGSHARNLAISATKSCTGHLLGAAGSVEFILTLAALRSAWAPPTLHWEEPDPRCPLDYVPGSGREMAIDTAMSLSFGFGGPIAVLVARK